MRAVRRGRVDLVLYLEKEYLPALDTFYLHLSLVAILQVKGCDPFEFVLLRHDANACAESSRP